MLDAGRHPNIELLTNSELVGLDGQAGRFRARVRRHPRYVSEELCTGCGLCSADCPSIVPNEFEVGMGGRKAIYSPFPQAVPNTYIIDHDACLNDEFLVCSNCANVCDRDAIDFDDPGEDLQLDIGAVIVATGFEVYDATAIPSYGYGIYPNVLTNMELERILGATGPTRGHIVRPTDMKPPRKIAFIQCVGSRGEGGDKGCAYCSRFCCMNAIKDALLLKQHEPNLEEAVIYYIDVRTAGRGFEEFYQRSLAEPGIRYVRGRPSKIMEDPETKDPIIYVEDGETGKISRDRVDMVVLSAGAVAAGGNRDLAEALGIDIGPNGFFKIQSDHGSSLHTVRDGVYLCGCASGIHDVSDSVSQASGAAALAEKHVERLPDPEPKEIEKIDTSGPPRIGVFLCHCGINIAGVLDMDSLKDYAAGLEHVVHVEENLFICSNEGQKMLQELIVEHQLNRVVAAACTPRTHEPLFRESCEQVGLNPYLFEMVNVRDQCAWVHSNVPDAATDKARDLIRMSVARARHLKPLDRRSIPVNRDVVVIGGGVAGMSTALELDAQGLRVTLIERSDRLGGRLNRLTEVYPANIKADTIAGTLLSRIKAGRVKVWTETEVQSITGFVGNFEMVTTRGQLSVGTIVIATGSDLYQPSDEFGYSKFGNVITNQELEDQLAAGNGSVLIDGIVPSTVVFIQCVGSRDPENNPACSRYCCPTTIKQAIKLRERGVDVVVMHRDMRTVGARSEELYREARAQGVKFLRYTPERLPRVTGSGDRARGVELLELALDRTLEIDADAVVLATGMVPQGDSTEQLHQLLKVPCGEDGFFMERHAKLGPVETNIEGVFLAGCAGGPKDIADSVAQGAAAAAKVAIISCRDTVSLEPVTCQVDQATCRACGKCVEICEYHAPELVDVVPGMQAAVINQALCKGCGTCASWCPTGSISANHFTDDQINSMLEALLVTGTTT